MEPPTSFVVNSDIYDVATISRHVSEIFCNKLLECSSCKGHELFHPLLCQAELLFMVLCSDRSIDSYYYMLEDEQRLGREIANAESEGK